MLKLSYIILLFLCISNIQAQSPHGKNFEVECSNCHQTDSWKVDLSKSTYDHNTSGFALIGQHSIISCLSCHKTLEFEKVNNLCYQCHKDIHENTLGNDCDKCHDPNSWVVEKITEIHQNSRFPLIGIHKSADCNQCHSSASGLRFDPIGIDCFDCHQKEYESATNPNHIAAGFSKECSECHNINANQWNMASIVHDFFPLTGGHDLENCFLCHKQNDFTGLSKECNTCHQSTFNTATNPNHVALNFDASNCSQCHTTNPGWKPANFAIHNNYYPLLGAHLNVTCINCHNDNYNNPLPQTCYGCHSNDYNNVVNPPHVASNFSTDCTNCHSENAWKPSTFNHDENYFPIYTGKHQGEWNNCSDCHSNAGNYKIFECINCHEHNKIDTDSKHANVSGYNYQSSSCYACHPTGDGDNAFNHSTTGFPLTGAHQSTSCSACHTDGYQGTGSACVDCHSTNYSSTTNPNHTTLNIGTDCQTCHSTDLGWKVTQFTIHDNFYPLLGQHNIIKDQCNTCHNGDYNNTPNTCTGCHITDYNNTTNPKHLSAGFSQECETCHTQTAWSPSTFNHDGTYFPIYTGKHQGEWNSCSDCHSNAGNYKVFECINCHEHNKIDTDSKHANVSGYNYQSSSCYACHPTGDGDNAFNHSTTGFPLTGAHQSTSCSACHADGYQGTGSACVDCHSTNYSSSTNPNHATLNFGTDCQTCHSTDLGWKITQFTIHNNFYPLLGQHNIIKDQCNTCHNGDYNNTPNTCSGCHITDYNNTTNPKHLSAGFPQECETCHTQTAWSPSTFNHDGPYFPIYTGKHRGEWNKCSDCHNIPSNFTAFECINCHEHSNQASTNQDHQGVANYVYNSLACYNCHPRGSDDNGTIEHIKPLKKL